jgi:hypothetical protein
VIVNNNFSLPIPKPFNYSYVGLNLDKVQKLLAGVSFAQGDLVDKNFPLYHDSKKLADIVVKNI